MDISAKCFVKESNFVTRCIADETIIVPIRDTVGDLDSIYTLNEVGTTIWQLIDGQTSGGEILEVICKEYEVAPEDAKIDVVEFLSSLEEAGLIKISNED